MLAMGLFGQKIPPPDSPWPQQWTICRSDERNANMGLVRWPR